MIRTDVFLVACSTVLKPHLREEKSNVAMSHHQLSTLPVQFTKECNLTLPYKRSINLNKLSKKEFCGHKRNNFAQLSMVIFFAQIIIIC